MFNELIHGIVKEIQIFILTVSTILMPLTIKSYYHRWTKELEWIENFLIEKDLKNFHIIKFSIKEFFNIQMEIVW